MIHPPQPPVPQARPTTRASARTTSRLLLLATFAGLALSVPAFPGEPARVSTFEQSSWDVPVGELDKRVLADQKRLAVRAAQPCSDAVFLRRVHLDLVGTLPEPEAARTFLADRSEGKRARLVEDLLLRPEFADLWSLRWCDTLRVKSEFPINLWPNAVQAYHRWVHEAVAKNLPYDVFARELLTSSGSNFRVPAVNFLRAVQGREPEALAGAAAVTFMGTRLASLPEDRRAGLAALFSRVAYKRTKEWKEEIVFLDPAPAGDLTAVLPDGVQITVPAGADPRRAFADWLVRADNPWFARAAVNRIWAWIFGRGIVHEPDDMRPDNPPVLPQTLDLLAQELADSGWDLRHVIRTIVNSRTYQQSPRPRGDVDKATRAFGCYPVRRLEAEVLIDALVWIDGVGEEYSSVIPEPYTFVPEENHTTQLADGSITSPFLELFGRPSRDTGLFSERSNEPTDDQRLYLLNSSDVLRRLERSERLRKVVQVGGNDVKAIVDGIYTTLLSRPPSEVEEDVARRYFVAGGRRRQDAAADLAWALLNTKEFLYRH